MVDHRVHFAIERLPKPPVIARLVVACVVVRYSEKPSPDVFLPSARVQMTLQTDKRVLHHILRFVAGKPQANEVTQQRLPQLAIQNRDLRRGGAPRSQRQRQGYGIVAHKTSKSRLYF